MCREDCERYKKKALLQNQQQYVHITPITRRINYIQKKTFYSLFLDGLVSYLQYSYVTHSLSWLTCAFFLRSQNVFVSMQGRGMWWHCVVVAYFVSEREEINELFESRSWLCLKVSRSLFSPLPYTLDTKNTHVKLPIKSSSYHSTRGNY